MAHSDNSSKNLFNISFVKTLKIGETIDSVRDISQERGEKGDLEYLVDGEDLESCYSIRRKIGG